MSRVVALVLAVAIGLPGLALAAGPSGLPRVLTLDTALRGDEDNELRRPVAVAGASAEELAVADAFGPRLLLFRKSGSVWRVERVVPLPGVPIALASDGERYLVSLRQGGGLMAYESPELLQRKIGLPRDVVPGALAVRSDGALLVNDFAQGRVLVLSREGALTAQIPLEDRVSALVAAPAGGFYAAVAERATVLRVDGKGDVTATWSVPGEGPRPAWPVGLALDPGGDVAVVDRHGARILVLDVRGKAVGTGSRRGWEPGLLRYPSAIARLPDGTLVVADQGNGRVQLFRRIDDGATR